MCACCVFFKVRTLASTWLLSAFAATGFILSSLGKEWAFIAIVAFAGSIGVFLLWMVDMKVYQQLTAAKFSVGLELEKEHKWLPQARLRMLKSQPTGTVISFLTWFYVIGVGLLLVLGICATSLWVNQRYGVTLYYCWPVLAVLVAIVVHKMVSKSDEESMREYVTSSRWIPRPGFNIGVVALLMIVFWTVHMVASEPVTQNDDDSNAVVRRDVHLDGEDGGLAATTSEASVTDEPSPTREAQPRP